MTDSHDHDASHLAHVMSPRQLLTVFGALILLTVVTVSAAGQAPAAMEIWISLGIATAKAGLVDVIENSCSCTED